jgi:hypothetical protein
MPKKRPISLALLSWCGIDLAGDIGPYTVYTNKNRKLVAFPRSPPKDPPTGAQLRQRYRFTLAIQNWNLLQASERTAWEELSLALSLPRTGLNVFIALSLNPDDASLQTAIDRTGIFVTPPPEIPR